MVQVALNPSEISAEIKKQIEKFQIAADARDEGKITSIKDGIARLHGLHDVMQGEMVRSNGASLQRIMDLASLKRCADVEEALKVELGRDSVGL